MLSLDSFCSQLVKLTGNTDPKLSHSLKPQKPQLKLPVPVHLLCATHTTLLLHVHVLEFWKLRRLGVITPVFIDEESEAQR